MTSSPRDVVTFFRLQRRRRHRPGSRGITDLVNCRARDKMAVSETWNLVILHFRSDQVRVLQTRFGGLQLSRRSSPRRSRRFGSWRQIGIHCTGTSYVRVHPVHRSSVIVENVRAGSHVVTVANIYRPSDSCMPPFFEEFKELLSSLCLRLVGQFLLLCDDFDRPECRGRTGDGELLALLNTSVGRQVVPSSTIVKIFSTSRHLVRRPHRPSELPLSSKHRISL